MAREKHPTYHDPAIQNLLRRTLSEEVLIPFESHERAAGMRRLVYALCRAHRLHKTDEAEQYTSFRSRIHSTIDVINQREHYEPNYITFPFTLLLDSRPQFKHNIELATAGGEPIDTRRSPTPSTEKPEEEIELTFEDLDEDDQGEQLADLLNQLKDT